MMFNLRNSGEVRLTTATKSASQNALFYKGMKMYNSLPKTVTGENSLFSFKKLLAENVMSDRSNEM